jgi:hypothetical protein
MEGTGEMREVGRETLHGGVVQSVSETDEYKEKTIDSEKDGQFRVQVSDYILRIHGVLMPQ